MTRPEENLHFWRLAAEEDGCFDQPYPFANDQARFLFYRQREPNLHYVPHEDHCCTVTLMSGLPGAGKDTWLAANRPGLPVVSLDDIRVELDIEADRQPGRGDPTCPRAVPGTPALGPVLRLQCHRTFCGRPGSGGSICSPIMVPASRSFTSNLRLPMILAQNKRR